MKKYLGIAFGVIVFIGLIIAANSYYIVYEDEVAVVKAFGEMVAVVVSPTDAAVVQQNLELKNKTNIEIISQKGLHFKVPFIQSVEKYSAKYLTYISNSTLINTNDERRVEIQMYAQYRVIDPVVFIQSVGTKAKANKGMDDYVYKTVINSANKLEFNEFFYQTSLEDLLNSKQADLNKILVEKYGIFVSDIGINYKSFPESNVADIEAKMAKEIEKDSEKLIAEGDSFYIKAQATTDRERTELISTAIETAAIVKADADAQAIRIYQESLQKDLDFYRFITRMEIYKNIQDSTIFLDNENGIFNLLDGYESILPVESEPVVPQE